MPHKPTPPGPTKKKKMVGFVHKPTPPGPTKKKEMVEFLPPSEAYYKALEKKNYARKHGFSTGLTLNSTTHAVKRQLFEREYAAEQALAKDKAKKKKK